MVFLYVFYLGFKVMRVVPITDGFFFSCGVFLKLITDRFQIPFIFVLLRILESMSLSVREQIKQRRSLFFSHSPASMSVVVW